MGRGFTYNEAKTLTRQLTKFEGAEWRDENDKTFGNDTAALLDAAFPNSDDSTTVEMVIDFTVEGWHDYGTMHGPWGDPGDLPDGDETRRIDDITIDGKTIGDLLYKALSKEYESEVDDVNVR